MQRHNPPENDSEERGELLWRLLFANGEGGPVSPAWWSSGDWYGAWQKAQRQGPCTCLEPYPWDTNDDGLPVWPERNDHLELTHEPGDNARCLVCLRPMTAAVQA